MIARLSKSTDALVNLALACAWLELAGIALRILQ